MPGIVSLETPRLILDRTVLRSNLERMARLARNHGLALRPHAKTHKSLNIARMQMDAGACGLTVSKTGEALVFVQGGIPSLTVAYPVLDSRKLDRLLETARDKGTDLRFMADCAAGVAALSEAARRHGRKITILLKIDVGLHRMGLNPDGPELVSLARTVSEDDGLELLGIMSHAGQAYGAVDRGEAREVAVREAAIMGRVVSRLTGEGLEPAEISVGSTPTVLAAADFSGITEIRPGNYVFMDRTPLRLGLCRTMDVALTVLSTVVGVNGDWLIIDAGSKVLSSDGGAHGSGMDGFGLAWLADQYPSGGDPLVVRKLSEEHGFVERKGLEVQPGRMMRIIPNHACAAANLADEYAVLKEDGKVEYWPVHARGRVL